MLKYCDKNKVAIANGINCDHHVPDPPLIVLLKHNQIPLKSNLGSVSDKLDYLKLLIDLSQKSKTPIEKQTVLKAIKLCQETAGDTDEILNTLKQYLK